MPARLASSTATRITIAVAVIPFAGAAIGYSFAATGVGTEVSVPEYGVAGALSYVFMGVAFR